MVVRDLIDASIKTAAFSFDRASEKQAIARVLLDPIFTSTLVCEVPDGSKGAI